MLELLYQDFMDRCPPSKRDELEQWFTSPIDAGPDDEVLQVMVDIGQADDLDEARDLWYLQKQISELPPAERAMKMQAWQQKRIERRQADE